MFLLLRLYYSSQKDAYFNYIYVTIKGIVVVYTSAYSSTKSSNGGENKMEKLLLWGLYVATFYAFLPGLISRTFGFRVFKKGRVEKEIALTFDDGPDPTYTPQLLDLLARYGAKATFFVVGSHAEGQEELLRRMKAEGHAIGIHNYVHKSNWVMRPRTVRRQIERTTEVIERAIGEQPTYYRPPWGIVNLFDYSNLGHLQIVLWSSMFGDWRLRVGAERLKRRMLKRLRPGEVLLLHDCGMTFGADQHAPANMLIALEAYLKAGGERGYSFIGMDEMIRLTDKARASRRSVFKRASIALWLMWERAFHFIFRLKTVGQTTDPAFHYRITTYTGKSVLLAEGDKLEKGDRIAELHFDNRKLSSIAAVSKSPVAAAIRMLREVEQGLPQLANQLGQDKEANDIKAVYGVTMIHRGADRVGFEVHKLPQGLFSKSTQIYLRLLLRVLTGQKRKQRSAKTAIEPRMLIMPAATIRSYATAEAGFSLAASDQQGEPVTIGAVADEAALLESKTSAI
jgi:peptidoglycan/xylan/chitin deacetylase (PgdA/CDA1 family)